MTFLNPTLNVALDIVCLTMFEGKAYVYLNSDDTRQYFLPGVLIKHDETIADAIHRIFKQKVTTNIDFNQSLNGSVNLSIKGDLHRDDRGRVISIPMVTLLKDVEIDDHWYDFKEIASINEQSFKFDHHEIIVQALLEMFTSFDNRLGLLHIAFTSKQLKDLEVYFNQIPESMTLSNVLKKYYKHIKEIEDVEKFELFHGPLPRVTENRGRPHKFYQYNGGTL